LDPQAVLFYEVEASVTTPFYIAIDSPGSGDAIDINNAVGDGNFLDILGGVGALTDPVARQLTHVDRAAAISNATLLSTTEFNNETGWNYVGPFLPSQGELLGNKYYFRIVFSIDPAIVDRNAFRLDISFSNSGNPGGSDQFRAFAYSWPIGLLGDSNGDAGGGTDRFYELYPFVAEGYGGSYALIASNSDLDNGQGAGATEIVVSGTSRAYRSTLPGLDPATDTAIDVAAGNGTTNNTRFTPTTDQDGGTWRMEYVDGQGLAGFASNPAEFWHWLAPTGDTINSPQFYAPGDPEVFEIVRTYSAFYELLTPHRIAVNADDGTAPASGTEPLTLQVVDAAGNPSASILEVFVEVSGDGRIASINGDTTGLPAASAYVTTTSDGLALLAISDSTPGTDDTVTVTVTTNGAAAPGGSGTEANLPGTNVPVAIDFLTNPDPEISSAANSSGDEGTTFVIEDVIVTDPDGGSITAANDIRIVLPTALVSAGATFNAAATETVGGTGPLGAGVTYEAGNTVAVVNATGPFAAGQTAVVQGLEITAPADSESFGSLQLSFDGDVTGDVTDDKIITIRTTSATFVWEGGTSTDWTTATNWAGGVAPGANDGSENIIIPIVTTGNDYPVMPAVDWSINNLSVDATATLTLGANNLTVGGVLSNEGTIILSGAGTINKNDTDSGTIEYTSDVTISDFGAVDYYNLTVNPGSGFVEVPVASSIVIANQLEVTGTGFIAQNATELRIGGPLLATALFAGADNGAAVTRFQEAGGGATSGTVSVAFGPLSDFTNVVFDDGGGGATYLVTGILSATGGTANVTVTGGTLDFNGTSSQIDGTFTNSDATLLPAGTALTLGALTSTGTITNSGANTVSVSGNVSLAGTFGTPANSTITVAGAGLFDSGGLSIGSLIVDPGVGNTVSVATSNLTLVGDLTINSGDLSDGGLVISLEGDFTNNVGVGGYTATGEFRFLNSAVTSTITGTTTFNNFTVPNTAANKTIIFPANVTQTVNGTFSAEGAPGNLVTLQSSATTAGPTPAAPPATNQWRLQYNGGAPTADYLAVVDSDLLGNDISPTNSTNVGGNDVAGGGDALVEWFISGVAYTWDDGGADSFWGTADNWNPAGVPGATDSATIPDGFGYEVILNGAESIADVTILGDGDANDAVLDLRGQNFTVNGVFANSGILRLRGDEAAVALNVVGSIPGTVEYYGPGATQTGLAAGNEYDTLVFVDNTAGSVGAATDFELSAALTVNTSLNITAGYTLDLNGQDLSVTGITFTNTGSIRALGDGSETITGLAALQSAPGAAIPGTTEYDGTGSPIFGNAYTNLQINGTGDITAGAALDLAGDLSILALGSLTMAGNDLSVGGDYSNAGAYVSGANTTTFDATAGPVTVTTGGTAADQDFQNLTINDGGGGVTFILAGDLDVDGALTVTGGTLVTGANSVTVGAGATVNDTLDATGQGAGDPLSVGANLAGTGSVSAGAGLVTVGGDISVNTFVGDTGNIDVAGSVISGTSFTASSGTTFVGGDLQPAVFADNNGTVELDGAAAATVDGLTFHNLTINKAAPGDTVAAGAGWDVTNALTLTRGNWVAGGFTHSVAGNWDSSAADFLFTEGTSTIQLTSDGIDVTTKGAGDQFGNLTVVNGTLGSGVTFQAATTVSGLTTARGALRSAGLALNLGNLTLTNGLLVDTTNGGAAPAGATVTLGAVTSAGNGLTLNAGTAGDVLASSFAGGGGLTITNSDDTTISGGITAGAITLTDSSGTISLHGTVNATSLTTAAQGYNLSILGAGSVIGGDTDLLNTGTLQLGNAGTDTVQFTGGLGATSAGTISVAGTVSTVGTQMDIGDLTLTANSVLDTGTAGASVLNVGAVSSAGFELTLDSGPNAALDLASFAGGGDLVVRDANGGTLGSAGSVTLNAFTLQDSTIALALGNALTASGAIDLQAGSFSMGGNPITVAGDWTVAAGVNFLNTNQPVTFNASTADQTITTSGTAADKDYYDVIVDTSGGFAAVLNGDILINRDLVFNSGAAVLDDGGNLLIVERNWDNTAGGTLTATGNVRFDDAAQTTQVLGATAFSDLTVTEDGKTVRFQSGQQQTVNGTLTVTGSAGAANLITLEPTVAATDWLLDNVGNTESIAFAVISYSDASAGAVVNATNSKDVQDTGASSNTNWDFGNSNLQWLGVNSNWDNDANWNNGYVPNPTDNVTIPDVGSAPNMPVLDTAGEGDETNNLTLTDPTSALTFTGAANDLTVNGVFSFDGTLNLEGDETLSASVSAGVAAAAAADQGTVIYGGQDALGLAAGDTYYNLEVSANTYTLDADLTVEGDITLSGGVLNAGAGPFNVTVHGQWTNSGGAYQPLTNTTTFTGQDGAGPFLIQTGGTAPGQQFANLTVDSPTNNRVFQLANNALATTGAVVIAAGDTLDAENGTGGPHNLSVGGGWTNSGTYLRGTNTTTFSGAGGAGPYEIDTGGTAAGQDFYRVVVGGGANQTYRLANNDLLVVEDLTIDAGDTLDAETGPGGPHNITVGQDYTNNGSFISGAGTVTFDGRTGAGPFLINSGGTGVNEDFGTVVFGAGSDLVYRLVGNSFTAAGSVTIDTGDELDVQGFSLTATTLNNNGTLRREGSGESVTRDNDSGLVIYDGAGGTVENYDDFVADYFGLEIAANQSVAGGDLIQTAQDLTVSSGTLSLTGDILTGRDLIIIAGAGVNGGSSTIQIGRNWTNGAGVGGFAAGSSTVELVAAATSTIQVTGNTNFYNLERNTGDIVIEFGAGETFGILPGGSLVLTGTGPADIESRVAAEFLPPPDSPPALSFAGQITITSTAPGPAPADRWIFDPDPSFTLTMQYVVVAYSETLINVVLPPLNILGPNTVNWLTFLPVSSSETIDTDGNGRIDRILVTLPVNHNNNFADMEVTVTGYTVTGIGPAVAPDQFIIDLAEKVELDTEVTPSWVIDQNTSLRDNISSTRIVVILTPPEVPVDSAPPIVAHTLAYSGGSQIYLRFSEPVFQIQPGTAPGPADFTVGGGTPPTVTSVTPVDAVGNGYEELLLFLDRPLGTADLAPPVSLSVNPVVEDGADRVILDPVVSISSLALTTGATPPITPVYAIDETITDPLSGGLGIIRDFDGSAFLTPETITMQVFREAGLPAPQLLYDSDVSAAVKPNGVWLPFELPGLTRDPYLTPLPAIAGSAVNAQLTEFTLPSTDARIRENVVLEFLIDTGLTTEISGSTVNYYAARVDTELAEPWYYSVRPFAFDLQNLVVQRGGVTIANNVIDPTAGQRATLNYTLESRQLVRVFVLDLAGALVKTVQNGIQNPGEYSLVWDGTNREGRPVSTGVYFVRIVAGETDEIRKVLVIRE